MELYQYRYFLAAADAGSFQVAADRLLITRQAISQSISQMEKILGYSLFHRSKDGLILTKEGEIFFPRIKTLISIQEEMERDMHRCCTDSRQTVRLYYTHTLYNLYENCFLDFQKQCDNGVTLKISGCQEVDCGRLLQDSEADIVISTFMPKFNGAHSRLLAQYPLSLMLSETHRLAKKDEIGLDDLRGETFLAYNSGEKNESKVYLPDCILTGVENSSHQLSDDLIYLFHRVRNNRGILLGVPENLDGLLKGVVFKPFPLAGYWNHYYTVSDSFKSKCFMSGFSDKLFQYITSLNK